ncbi:MAG: hypothetical protein ACOYK1_02140 [Vampirovibrionia bacterium]
MEINNKKDIGLDKNAGVKSAVDGLKTEATQQADSQKNITRGKISELRASIDDLESSKIDSASGSIDSLTDKTQVIYQENTGQNVNRSVLRDEITMTILGQENEIKNPQYTADIKETFAKEPNLVLKGSLETDNSKLDAAISHLTGKLDEKTQELNLLEGSNSVVEVVNGVQNEILDPEKVEEEIRSETNSSQKKTDDLGKDKDSSQEISGSIIENAHSAINILNENTRERAQRE